MTPSTELDERWMVDAACRGLPAAMFAVDNQGTTTARRVCARCPVAELCLWWAICAEEPEQYTYGIYGGLGPDERRRLAASVPPTIHRLNLAVERAWWSDHKEGAG